MINKRISFLIKKLYRFIGLFCIISVFTMFGMVISDLTKSEYNFAITPASYPPMKISSSGGFYSHSLIIVGSGKADLSVNIVNLDNEIVFEYEHISISAFGTILDRNVKFHIPALKPGIYKVKGILYYSANLLMQSKIYIDMGTVVVEDEKNE